jgi:hypothetical protein
MAYLRRPKRNVVTRSLGSMGVLHGVCDYATEQDPCQDCNKENNCEKNRNRNVNAGVFLENA